MSNIAIQSNATMSPTGPGIIDSGGTESPRALSEQELTLAAAPGATGGTTTASQPTMSPPGTPGALAVQEGAAAWLTGKKVVALWANRSARSAYAYIESVGWKRLADTNDSAHGSLTMLASAARQTGSTVHVRDEGDGRIREIYVW